MGSPLSVVVIGLLGLLGLAVLVAVPFVFAAAVEIGREKASREEDTTKTSAPTTGAPIGATADERSTPRLRVTGSGVASLLERIHTLQSADLLSGVEAKRERSAVLQRAEGGWTDESLIDFLEPFSGLLTTGAITSAEVEALKRLYSRLAEGRRTRSGED